MYVPCFLFSGKGSRADTCPLFEILSAGGRGRKAPASLHTKKFEKQKGDNMENKIISRVKRVAASVLAAVTLFSQAAGNAVYAAEPRAATNPVVLAEINPFDGFYNPKHSNGSVSACNANIMEVEIAGEKYLAYCLNPNRYGADHWGDQVGESGYSVEVHDLTDPALESLPDFQSDKAILVAMQGVISSGGYVGGGDSEAVKLMDPYDRQRPLYKDHLEAYAVTKYAMWSIVSEWYGPDWKINGSATYKPQDLDYLHESLTNLIGWATNYTGFNDANIYVYPIDDGSGSLWQENEDTGEFYIEYQVWTGRTGDNRDYVALGSEYTITPSSSLPAGVTLQKVDGTPITGPTTMRGAVSSKYASEDKFRVVAAEGTDLSAIDKDTQVAEVSTEIQTYTIKYGIGVKEGAKVQNYALVPQNSWMKVAAPVTIEGKEEPTPLEFKIKKVNGGSGLAGAEFRVTGPGGFDETYTTPSSGVISVGDIRNPGTYKVQETKAPSGFALDSTVYEVIVQEGGEEVVLTVENGKSTGLRIQKKDALTDENLAGAVFTVTNIGTGWSTDVVTGDTGQAVLSGLAPGDYRVEEKTPPAGYLPAENPVQTIKLEENKVGQLVYKNEPINGTVKIIKTAENDGDPLAGVTFTIKRRDGAEQWSVTTGENGEAEIELPADWYVITETDAPPNVEIDPTPHTVELKPDQTYELRLTNVLKKQLIIEKRDSKTNELVPCMIVEIKSPEGDLFGDGNCGRGPGVYQIGETGQLTFDNMETGTTWVITELEAPPGYVLNSTPQTVKIEGDVTTVTIRNDQKPGLLLRKVDSDTGKPIMGAKFTFTIPGTSTVYTRVTDNNGVIFLEDLDVTAIVIQEVEPAPGYIANDTPMTVQLIPNERVDVTFKNTSKPGLRITKVDQNGDPVPGVVIKVSRADGSVVGEYTTDSTGIIFIPNLEPGTFDVQEISAPPQYEVDSTVHKVTLEEGKIAEITLRNELRPTLRIVKVDSVTKGPIQGVTFEVRVTDGPKIGDYVTDENGEILVPNLQARTNYTITETATLPGYILDETPKQVTLEENKVTTVQFENKAKSPVYILKLDSETGEGVPGVTFRVTMADGSLVGEVTTDSTGRATLTNVPAGYITVTEIRVPDGYVLDPTPQTKLVDGENPVTFTFYNKPYGSILIKKLNAETRNPLAGAIFKVTEADGTLVGENCTSGPDGTVLVSGLDPEKTYVVTETRAPDGFLISDGPKTVTVKPGDVVEVVFENKRVEDFTIRKVGSDGKPIAGVTFLVSTLAGEEIARVTTGTDGLAVLTGIQPGSYKVQEISVPEGVILDSTPHVVEVVAGKPTTITVVNDYEGGLRIVKTVTQSGKPLKGVTFEIRKPDGALIGEYTTDENGEIFVDLEPQTVVVRETRVPNGYSIDSTPRTVEIKPNEVTVLYFENEKQGNIVIHKIDADSHRGLYGAVFLLMDEDRHTIAQLVTDRDGYAELDEDIPDGVYYIREIKAPAGYTLDDRVKRIVVKNGATEEILWENSKTRGQIQIIKKSSDDNPINGKPAGSLLEGAIFEIVNAETGVVVDRVVSDYRGVAASKPLPIGRYRIREITAPDFYQLNKTEFEVSLKIPNDIVQVEVLNASANISTSVKKSGNTTVRPGQQMRYDFSDIANTSNVPLNNFFWHDEIPTDAVRLNVIHTGTWNQPGLTYSVTYKTNLTSTYRTLAGGLLSTQSYDLDCSPSKLGLASNEYITDFRFEFGTVQPGFRKDKKPMILVTVLQNLQNGYRFANRTDVGGKYGDKWFTSNFTWVTEVIAPPVKYPTTGY